jgi:membrane-bound lytic murein transglycosylase D
MYNMARKSITIVLCYSVIFFFSTPGFAGEEKKPVQKPYLVQFTTPRSLVFCGERVPLERDDIWERLDREFLLSLGKESQVILWLKRSRRYFPFIEERLKHYNLPDDIKYVAVAESDFYPCSLSPKGAAGFWQFMQDTGRRYGLKNQDKIDERYSFPKSTDAAFTYLKFLHEQFGKWTLAIAAYNCGEVRVIQEMAEQGVADYFDLDLPQETEEYLFRIFAIKIILSNPARYGFELPESEYYRPLDIKEVSFYLPKPVHIKVIADAAQTTFKTIRDLNPELRGHYLPDGSYTLFIPRKNSEKFSARLKAKLEEIEGNVKNN